MRPREAKREKERHAERGGGKEGEREIERKRRVYRQKNGRCEEKRDFCSLTSVLDLKRAV